MKDLESERIKAGGWQNARGVATKLYAELRADYGPEDVRTILDLTERILNGGNPDFRVCKFCGCTPPVTTQMRPVKLADELKAEFSIGMVFMILEATHREVKRELKIARVAAQVRKATTEL